VVLFVGDGDLVVTVVGLFRVIVLFVVADAVNLVGVECVVLVWLMWNLLLWRILCWLRRRARCYTRVLLCVQLLLSPPSFSTLPLYCSGDWRW